MRRGSPSVSASQPDASARRKECTQQRILKIMLHKDANNLLKGIFKGIFTFSWLIIGIWVVAPSRSISRHPNVLPMLACPYPRPLMWPLSSTGSRIGKSHVSASSCFSFFLFPELNRPLARSHKTGRWCTLQDNRCHHQ